MSESSDAQTSSTLQAALEAYRRGYTPVPIRNGEKRPYGADWGIKRWASEDELSAEFARAAERGHTNIGLLLGEGSGGLVDVDLDHPKAVRLQEYFLPPTKMRSGRVGRPRSHLWYVVKDNPPAYRKHTLHTGETLVELRISGMGTGHHQTVIPPSIWTDKTDSTHIERYRWHGQPWGGQDGPAIVGGRKLSTQVALLALGATLLDNWPHTGSRHDAYLALAGALLRYGDIVHPWWGNNLPILITALAGATDDEDGPEARVKEVMGTTVKRLRDSGKASGWPTLAEILGEGHVEKARQLARDVVEASGWTSANLPPTDSRVRDASADREADADDEPLTVDHERDPMEERTNSWEPVELSPYLSGQRTSPEPAMLERVDPATGEVAYLVYPFKVNSLYGMSESGKTWIALTVCTQELSKGGRIGYIDLEDDPETMVGRLRDLGAGDEDIRTNFRYIHPEGPIAELQHHARRGQLTTEAGRKHSETFIEFMTSHTPSLLVLDGLNVLYGYHGHDTNEAAATSVIFSWLSHLTRHYRTTVLVIDHTGKAGFSMVGAHQKTAQVRGVALRADVVHRPIKGRDGGEVNLVVTKDSPGAVRKVALDAGDDEMIAATVFIDSAPQPLAPPSAVRVRVHSPDSGFISKALPWHLMKDADRQEAVMAIITDPDDTFTVPQLAKLVSARLNEKVTDSSIRGTCNELDRQERLTKRGITGNTRYQLGPRAGGHPRV